MRARHRFGSVAATAVVLASGWWGRAAGAQGESTNVQLVRSRFRLIRAERSYRVWTNVDEQEALKHARAEIIGSLTGQLIAVKDNIDLDWLPTSAGTRVLRNRLPARNATVVDRLLAAGGIVPGHTNMDTWARGVRTVSETTGATANGRNPRLGPMGSSGGTAVAVALGHADAGLGTDTCGSLRYPAAANLVYGLRPTPGLVSRSGVIPLSPTQDVVGPMGPSIASLATILDVIAGPDQRDPLTLLAPVRERTYTDLLKARSSEQRWRIGVVTSLGPYRRDRSGQTMLTRMQNAGIELVDVDLPVLPAASVIESESPRTRAMVRAEAEEGSWMTSPTNTIFSQNGPEYARLLAAQTTVTARLTDLLDANRLDALAYPTTPFLPALRGAPQPSANCHLAATGALPALAIPHGMNIDGVPVPGIDVLGRRFDEATLLAIGQDIEQGGERSRADLGQNAGRGSASHATP